MLTLGSKNTMGSLLRMELSNNPLAMGHHNNDARCVSEVGLRALAVVERAVSHLWTKNDDDGRHNALSDFVASIQRTGYTSSRRGGCDGVQHATGETCNTKEIEMLTAPHGVHSVTPPQFH